MYSNQKPLRKAAEQALRQQGYETEILKGSGGARLRIRKDGQEGLALVRTSSDRWVGWMRKDGEWKGFEEADLVVVAAIDNMQRPRDIEVYAFEPEVVHQAYVDNLAARLRSNPDFRTDAPVFIGLDPCLKGKPSSTASNLKEQALWSSVLPLDDADKAVQEPSAAAPATVRPSETREKFAARVRQEFADLIGVPADKVSIEFRVAM